MLYRSRHPFPPEKAAFPVPTGPFRSGPRFFATCRLLARLLPPPSPSLRVYARKIILSRRRRAKKVRDTFRDEWKSIGNYARSILFSPAHVLAREAILTQNQSTTPGVEGGVRGGITLSSLNRLFDRYEPIPLFRQYLHPVPANVCTVLCSLSPLVSRAMTPGLSVVANPRTRRGRPRALVRLY